MAKTIDISREQIQDLLEHIEKHDIKEEEYSFLKSIVITVISINDELVKKTISIKRLRKLFAIQSEKSSNILPI